MWGRQSILLGAALCLGLPAAAAPPTVSDEIGLDKGKKRQLDPALAFNGDTFLVSWKEEISPQAWTLRATRVSQAGALVDAAPVDVASGAKAVQAVRVGSNGSDFLVAWLDSDAGVLARRISAQGVPLDPEPLVIDVPPGLVTARLAVSARPATYLLTWLWQMYGEDCYKNHTRVARLSSSGQLLDAPALYLTPTQCWPFFGWTSVGVAPAHDFGFKIVESHFLAYPPALTLEQLRVPESGKPLAEGPDFSVASNPAVPHFPELARGPKDYLVVVSVGAELWARVLLWSGQPAWSPVQIASSGPVQERLDPVSGVGVVHDGVHFVVQWSGAAARVREDGVVLDPGGFQVGSDVGSSGSALATNGLGRSLVAYHRSSVGPGSERVFLRFVDEPCGTTACPEELSDAGIPDAYAVEAGGAAGAAGAGGASGSGGGTSDASVPQAGKDAGPLIWLKPKEPVREDGCGCSIPSAAHPWTMAALVTACAAALLCRRRRRQGTSASARARPRARADTRARVAACPRRSRCPARARRSRAGSCPSR